MNNVGFNRSSGSVRISKPRTRGPSAEFSDKYTFAQRELSLSNQGAGRSGIDKRCTRVFFVQRLTIWANPTQRLLAGCIEKPARENRRNQRTITTASSFDPVPS